LYDSRLLGSYNLSPGKSLLSKLFAQEIKTLYSFKRSVNLYGIMFNNIINPQQQFYVLSNVHFDIIVLRKTNLMQNLFLVYLLSLSPDDGPRHVRNI